MSLHGLALALWSAPAGPAPLARFAASGGTATLVQSAVFLLAGGSQAANLLATAVGTVLANELHRRVTFHAGGRTTWWRAQWTGGGVALVGLAATSSALALWETWAPGASAAAALAVLLGVTTAVGLARFLVLRRVLSPTPTRA